MFCSLFEIMENYQGDLTDVIRAAAAAKLSSDFDSSSSSSWSPLYPNSNDPFNFGDPFSTSQDPLLHSMSTFNFVTSNSLGFGSGGGGNSTVSDTPCNIFSRMLEISPCSKLGVGVIPGNSPTSTSTSTAMTPSSDMMINNGSSSNSKPVCLIDNSGIQISSPRNPGIKRRKSQVKKVVCIPAPAPANSRASSGEVVPSDLWAWRKYGQKPIKGSPYPRGYYRCSSSKGCSARKQVERSRTDPNMLVITYTSDHNHPWPTQRNALAGSTRGQPSRSSSSSSNKIAPPTLVPKTTPLNDDRNCDNSDTNASPPPLTAGENCGGAKAEEVEDQIDMDDGDHDEFPYELTLPVSNHCGSDFFADFGDMNDYLLFSQNQLTENSDGSKDDQKKGEILDPFSQMIYGNWPQNNDTNSYSLKEARGG